MSHWRDAYNCEPYSYPVLRKRRWYCPGNWFVWPKMAGMTQHSIPARRAFSLGPSAVWMTSGPASFAASEWQEWRRFWIIYEPLHGHRVRPRLVLVLIVSQSLVLGLSKPATPFSAGIKRIAMKMVPSTEMNSGTKLVLSLYFLTFFFNFWYLAWSICSSSVKFVGKLI